MSGGRYWVLRLLILVYAVAAASLWMRLFLSFLAAPPPRPSNADASCNGCVLMRKRTVERVLPHTPQTCPF